MKLEDLTIGQLNNEKEVRSFLQKKGFETNYNKKTNGNGEDILALKNGHSFRIEIKKVLKNKTTGAYKLSDNKIKGDILILIIPNGKAIVSLSSETSITKTIRFLLELN